MQWLHGFLHPEIGTRRVEVIIVGMPYQSWPGIAAHPLYYSGSSIVFMQTIGFHHCTVRLIILGLRFGHIILNIIWLAVSADQCSIENFSSTEISSAAMIIPIRRGIPE